MVVIFLPKLFIIGEQSLRWRHVPYATIEVSFSVEAAPMSYCLAAKQIQRVFEKSWLGNGAWATQS
jgi:hypothetical protein